jgi:homoserine O-acetyltransferase/O-succinyltransferase
MSIAMREGVIELPGQWRLYHGDTLPGVKIAYCLAGPADAPVVAALGGISANRYVAGPDEAGWWREIVGPGKALDTSRFRVLGIDYLGGNGASSAPQADGRFPPISSYDQADVLLRVADELGVARLHAILGASYGGMVALAFAEKYAGRVGHIIVVSAADRTHPMSTAWRSVQRRIVRDALQRGAGAEGLVVARALAMATYRSPAEFAARFRAAPVRSAAGFRFPVEDYLFARGENYAGRYQAASFVCLSESIDLHAISAERIATSATLIAVREDQLVPILDIQALKTRLGAGCRCIEINSIFGHDAFLKEGAVLKPLIERALAEKQQ